MQAYLNSLLVKQESTQSVFKRVHNFEIEISKKEYGIFLFRDFKFKISSVSEFYFAQSWW